MRMAYSRSVARSSFWGDHRSRSVAAGARDESDRFATSVASVAKTRSRRVPTPAMAGRARRPRPPAGGPGHRPGATTHSSTLPRLHERARSGRSVSFVASVARTGSDAGVQPDLESRWQNRQNRMRGVCIHRTAAPEDLHGGAGLMKRPVGVMRSDLVLRFQSASPVSTMPASSGCMATGTSNLLRRQAALPAWSTCPCVRMTSLSAPGAQRHPLRPR